MSSLGCPRSSEGCPRSNRRWVVHPLSNFKTCPKCAWRRQNFKIFSGEDPRTPRLSISCHFLSAVQLGLSAVQHGLFAVQRGLSTVQRGLSAVQRGLSAVHEAWWTTLSTPPTWNSVCRDWEINVFCGEKMLKGLKWCQETSKYKNFLGATPNPSSFPRDLKNTFRRDGWKVSGFGVCKPFSAENRKRVLE